MTETASTFIAKSTFRAGDLEHRRKINFNISRYDAAVPWGKQQFADLETAKERAKNIKWKAIDNLDVHLQSFEANISKRGAKVIWASDTEEALSEILRICKEKKCRSIVKSKSLPRKSS